MNNKELVSIITPMYNAERFVAETIRSVRQQTYKDWEMIIINDGSTDGSLGIVEELAQQDARIRVYSQPNQGCSAARNHGMRLAEGRYIALLDADDVWEPWFIEQQLRIMKERNCQLVYGGHKRIGEDGEEVLQAFIPPKKVSYKDLLRTCSITCLTGLYDTVPYGKIYLNERFKNLRDDYVYWLEILRNSGKAYGNQGVVGSYRMVSNRLTSNKWKMIGPQWRVYRDVVKLGIVKSGYYMLCWAVNGIIKYWK